MASDDQQSSVMAIEVTKVSTQSPTWIVLLLTQKRATRYRLPICGWPQRFPLPLQSGLIRSRSCYTTTNRPLIDSLACQPRVTKGSFVVIFTSADISTPAAAVCGSFSVEIHVTIPLPYLAVCWPLLRSIVIYAARFHPPSLFVLYDDDYCGNYIPINNN